MFSLLRLIPGKVWAGALIVVLISLSFTYTYNKGYRAAEVAITSEHQIAYDKLLTQSLKDLNNQLEEALDKREKDLIKVQELNSTLKKSEEYNYNLEKSLNEITSKPNPCNNLRADYFKLYQELYNAPTE